MGGKKRGQKKGGEKPADSGEPSQPRSGDAIPSRPQSGPPRPATQPEAQSRNTQEQPRQESVGPAQRPQQGHAPQHQPGQGPPPQSGRGQSMSGPPGGYSQQGERPGKPAWGPKGQTQQPKMDPGAQRPQQGYAPQQQPGQGPPPQSGRGQSMSGPPRGYSQQGERPSKPAWGPKGQTQQPKMDPGAQRPQQGHAPQHQPGQGPPPQSGRGQSMSGPPRGYSQQGERPGKPARGPKGQTQQSSEQPVQAQPPQSGPAQRPRQSKPQQQPVPLQVPQEQPPRAPSQASTPSTATPRASPETNVPSGEGLAAGITSMEIGLSSNGVHPPLKRSRPPSTKKTPSRPIPVETNHLALSINYKMTVYHYDVVVKPEKPFRLYWPALIEVQRRFYPTNWPAFDGRKNIYSALKLPFPKGDELVANVTVYDEENERDKDVEIVIKFVKALSLQQIEEYLRSGRSTMPAQEAIQAIDVVLRQPASARFTRIGRSFFTPPAGQVISLGDGLDLWYGFFQSAIIGQKPFLNIDVAHKGFPASVNCIEALAEFTREKRIQPNNPVDSRDVDRFIDLVKGLKIAYTLPNGPKKTYKVNSVGQPANCHKFKLEDGTQLTVAEYFQNTKNYRLKYPCAPVLLCGQLNRLAFPAELCTIVPGQVVLKKLNEIQTRTMVSKAATPAPDRKNKIYQSLQLANFGSSPHLKEFGLNVDQKFTQINARVLRAPSLLYRNNKNVSVVKGVWTSQMFLQSSPLTNWVIYCVDKRTREEDLRGLEGDLIRTGRELGMEVRPASHIQCIRQNSDFASLFSDCLKKQVQLIIFVLNDRGPYATVKKVAETEVGVLTQCLKARTIMRLSKATVTNILLKVNSKLNGINHNIVHDLWPKFFARPVMVVGADVTHPSPDQTDIPSVAAVAASHDPSGFNYNMEWRLQDPREEMIKDLTPIMIKQLKFFYTKTGLKPEAILFYRDGVSEGQFKAVLNQEVRAIRQACTQLNKDYKPPITFLVVQKRHHTRFFPLRKEDEDGRNKNVPAGTIVDNTITHPTEVDFYLVSHASIQGTSRPTKYHLLWDDSDMSVDELEEVTYYLCHLFSRCTRSVSYPAPTYYAHLAAFRIRHYIENMRSLTACKKFQTQVTDANVHSEFTKSSPMFFV